MQNVKLQRFATFLIKKINKIFLYVKKNLSLQRTQTILPMLDYTIPTIFFAVSLAVCSNAPRLPVEVASVQRVTPQYFFLMYNLNTSKKWKKLKTLLHCPTAKNKRTLKTCFNSQKVTQTHLLLLTKSPLTMTFRKG